MGFTSRAARAEDQSSSTQGRAQGGGRANSRKIAGLPQGRWRNRRDSVPRSPAQTLQAAALRPCGLEPPPAKPLHANPPIPLFKIPPAQWPIVLQRVAQGESLRQIAWSYRTSYEAVRRVLNASRKDLLGSQCEPAGLPPVEAKEEPAKE